jgi:hypothetical protein
MIPSHESGSIQPLRFDFKYHTAESSIQKTALCRW